MLFLIYTTNTGFSNRLKENSLLPTKTPDLFHYMNHFTAGFIVSKNKESMLLMQIRLTPLSGFFIFIRSPHLY